jgi:hypothetical protein
MSSKLRYVGVVNINYKPSSEEISSGTTGENERAAETGIKSGRFEGQAKRLA